MSNTRFFILLFLGKCKKVIMIAFNCQVLKPEIFSFKEFSINESAKL